MEQVANRCIAAAAAGLTMGGLIAAIASVTPSLPDVQVRDLGLTASLQISPNVQVETVENHIRPDLVGAGDLDHAQNGLADVLYGRGEGSLQGLTDPTSNTSEFTLDQNELTNLLGGGFAPEAIRQGLILDPIVPGVTIPGVTGTATAGGAAAANEAGAANMINTMSTAVMGLAQSLPLAQQAFSSGVAAAELQFNNALVDAQTAAVDRFGASSEVTEVVNWMFNLNNSVIAHNEAQMNSLLGITLDPAALQASLLTVSDPTGAAAEQAWNALTALNPDEFASVVHAIQGDSLAVLLGSVDWSSLFPGIF